MLRALHHTMFHSVGERFIQHYNQRYQLAVPWGLEWAEQSMAYLHYLLVVQSYNSYHSKWPRSFPPGLQDDVVDRITVNIALPNLLLDPAPQWPDGVVVSATLPPQRRPAGNWQMLQMHQRQQLRQVGKIQSTKKCMFVLLYHRA